MNKLVMLASMAVCMAACTSNKRNVEEVNKYIITSPLVIDTNYVSEYVADIHSILNVEIRTKIKGHLENIYVDEGALVKEGQLLFSISKEGYNLELLKAQSKLKSAVAELKIDELELENVRKLHEKNIVSKTELDKAIAIFEAANARIEEARSEVQSARLNLSFTDIRAPFEGIIDRIPFKKGSLIPEGTLLTSLSNNKEVFAYFNVSEKEYLGIRAQKASLEENNITLLLANNKPHQYKGNIETIDGEFDKSTGNIAFRAKFPNPDMLLRHGSSGKVQIENELKNALVIPQKSTYEIQDKFYVFLIDSNNIVRSRNVIVKQRIPHLFVIENNLQVNDKIIYEGIQNIRDGDKVMTEFLSLKQIISKFKTQ